MEITAIQTSLFEESRKFFNSLLPRTKYNRATFFLQGLL
jgi:hypothetical protein